MNMSHIHLFYFVESEITRVLFTIPFNIASVIWLRFSSCSVKIV